jgi:hypothetical protein
MSRDPSALDSGGSPLDDPKIVSISTRFKKADEESTPVVEKQDFRGCDHKLTTIDDKLPLLTCRTCDAQLDPYVFLRELARHYRDRDYRWEAIKEQQKRAAQEAEAALHGKRTRFNAARKINAGEYVTRKGDYLARPVDGAWEVVWNDTIVRRAPTLASCRAFVRNHVRANWGKEPNRTEAQREIAKHHATENPHVR